MSFAEALRSHRRRLGWTQQELADAAGLTQGAITNLERGVNPRPSADTVQHLAQALGLTFEALMTDAGLGPPANVLSALNGVPDAALQQLIRIWQDLTPEDRETAVALTQSLLERRKNRKNGQKHPIPQ